MGIVITRSEAISSLRQLEDDQFPDGEEYFIPNYTSMTNEELRDELCLSGTYHDTKLDAVVDDASCKRSHTEVKSLSTESIRIMIPGWATDEEVDMIRKEFEWNKLGPGDLVTIMRNPKNWKRFSKFKKAAVVERVFKCKPLGDQLPLYIYVISDLSDKKILNYYFSTD